MHIDFEGVADEENEQEFDANQSKDVMSEGESDSDSSSWAGSEYLNTYNELFLLIIQSKQHSIDDYQFL